MAQTFLIRAPIKAKNGKVFRVIKDRAWDDMPFSFLVQKLCENYSAGRMVKTWRYTDTFTSVEEAVSKFEKMIAR
jgi:hypothetical protein